MTHEDDLEFCKHLGTKGYKPGAIMEGCGYEIVSYPFPENGVIYIMARTTPGDPTTMKKFKIILARLVEV